ncbi:MAG: cadherin domain-containing protein, partial [Planctomycetota bacterium]
RDADSDLLTYTATLENGSPLPAWLTFDPTARAFSGTARNEDIGVFEIRITATDSASAATDDQFNLSVSNTNNAPTGIAIDNLVLDENAPGAVVGNVEVSDPDVGDSHTLTVDDERFEIVAGQLKLKADVALDYETTPSIEVAITATDSGSPPLSRTDTFVVSVVNVNEPPIDLDLSSSNIDENSPVDSVIGLLSATDPDADDAHAFTLVNDAGGRFKIDGNQLLVADASRLNFELASSHNVTIQVRDSGGLTLSKSFDIVLNDMNESPTAIHLTSTQTKENVPSAVIGRLVVVDEDAGDTHTLTVSHDDFELDGDMLRLKEGRSLTYDEANPTIIVPITAVDSGGLSYTEQIAIVVLAHPLPWQNEANATDANADGSVSPLDALVIINYINEFGPGGLPVPPPTTIVFYYDTNGDGSVSPVDVLMIINLLNSNLLGAEGENSVLPLPTPPTPVAAAPTSAAALTQRALSSNATGTDAYFDSLRDHRQDEPQRADASERTAASKRTVLDELIHDLFKLQSTTETEDIFAGWR